MEFDAIYCGPTILYINFLIQIVELPLYLIQPLSILDKLLVLWENCGWRRQLSTDRFTKFSVDHSWQNSNILRVL